MGAVYAIVILGVITFVSIKVGNARTSARKSSNAAVQRSLDVRSRLGTEELSSLVTSSLSHAGATKIGAFDNTSFFRLSSQIELDLTVTAEGAGSRAQVALRNVRTVSGRPQRLAPVGRALDAAARMITEHDQSATII
jgi:hypothetical protein